jgi:hypothetical protein
MLKLNDSFLAYFISSLIISGGGSASRGFRMTECNLSFLDPFEVGPLDLISLSRGSRMTECNLSLFEPFEVCPLDLIQLV